MWPHRNWKRDGSGLNGAHMNSLVERKTRIRTTRPYRQRHALAIAVSAGRRRGYRMIVYLLAIFTGLTALLINFLYSIVR